MAKSDLKTGGLESSEGFFTQVFRPWAVMTQTLG